MNDLEAVYSTVQQEADETRNLGARHMMPLLVATLGIGMALLLIGVLL